jgi:hypothetical protein
MPLSLTDRQVSSFRIVCIGVLLTSFGCFVAFTIHWPWLWDTQVMHYIALLLDHGKVPYRDIYDINMPGSYLTEQWALAVFGGGNLGWRLYEFLLLGLMTLGMVVIALPYDWLAGLFAGAMFTMLHGTEGPYNAAQRDEVMTMLILVAFAALFTAIRRGWPPLMIAFGFSLGMATLIKPTVAPLALVCLGFAYYGTRKSGRRVAPYLLYAFAGLGIALCFLLKLLLPHGAFGSFLFILRQLVPYYSSLATPPFRQVFNLSLPRTFLFYAPAAAILAIANRTRANWELWAIRLGFLFGAASYFVQRKGYTYHRYTYLAFGLLWIGIEFTTAMRDRGWRRNLGVVAMAFAVFLMIPFNVYKTKVRTYNNVLADQLTTDIEHLGGARLNGRVQCLDLTSGCLTALYRLDLVQSTGFTGDLQFFAKDDGKVVPYYRKIFWDDIHADPPQAIILTNEFYMTGRYTFDKLNTWPQFRDYLNSAYHVAVARDLGSYEGNEIAYRIYVPNEAGH